MKVKILKNKNLLLVLSAPSGAGKTTIAREFIKKHSDFSISISSTTRKPRGNEKNGVDYFFLSENDFKKKIDDGQFLEWAKVHDNYYGTSFNEVERIREMGKNVLFDIDVQGGINVKKKYPSDTILVFILPPSPEILKKRLLSRNTDSLAVIEKRLQNAKKEIKMAMQKYEYIIINDDLTKAVLELENVVSAFERKIEFNEEVFREWLK